MAAERAYDYYAYEAAPERVPVRLPDKKNKPELKKAKKTREEILIYDEKRTNRKVVKAAVLILSFLVLYAVVCNSFIAKDTARRDLEAAKEEYAFAQAQNKELRGELNNLISAENIDRIAVEDLGLVKVAAGSEIYLDSAQDNKVIFSRNK